MNHRLFGPVRRPSTVDLIRSAALVCALAGVLSPAQAAISRACPASLPLGTFQLAVKPMGAGEPRPARQTNVIEKGQKIAYAPVEIPEEFKKGKISLVMVPMGSDTKVTVTDPEDADEKHEWAAPSRVSVLALVFGPQGLSHKKVESLVTKDRELVSQLADYAEQTAQAETLIEALSTNQPQSRNLDAALTGFASRYGTTMTRIDRTQSGDQQALALVGTLNPALTAVDPLAPDSSARMQQSVGLATSVAGMFFGTNVGIAAGGAALLENFRTMMFPGTDFRTALAQPATAGPDGFTLCAKRQPQKARTRIAYLWAYRVPNQGPPAVKLASAAHVPLGVKSAIAFAAPKPKDEDSKVPISELTAPTRAHDWSLVGADGKSYPLKAKTAADGQSLEVDLRTAQIPNGAYQLAAKWDWTPFQANGQVNVHTLADLKTATVTVESRDRLVEGTGPVPVKLAGPDFEFIEKMTIDKQPAEFKLPTGKRAGFQPTVDTVIDTNKFKAGQYQIAMVQPDGKTADVPVRVLPPNPVIRSVPMRVNLGEAGQKVTLRGTGLARIEKIESPVAQIELGPCDKEGTSREMTVKLGAEAHKGDRPALALKVEGMEKPLEVQEALEIAGPRPKIDGLSVSAPEEVGVALREGELPAGTFVSVSMRVENAETRPTVYVDCAEKEKTLEPQKVRAGEKRPAARLDGAGPDTLFLSFDAGAIGRAGCTLMATLETEVAGKSDARALGRVVRLPRITGFNLTDEKVDESTYVGVLTGFDLETIDRAGWDPHAGVPVNSLPKQVIGGERDKQTLRISLRWPAPTPHAPVYVWLRGESEGRATKARF